MPHTSDHMIKQHQPGLSIIKSGFDNLNLTWDEAMNTAIDIKTWETIVNDL